MSDQVGTNTYQQSPEFAQLSKASKKDYMRYHDILLASWGDLAVAGLEPRHVLKLRDQNASTPSKANYIVRVLSSLISWGVPRGYRNDNPCQHVKKLKIGEGYAPWSWDAIAEFERHAPKELW